MNQMKLVYNFKHFYGSGMNTFLVDKPNFEYYFWPEEEDTILTDEELHDKYWKKAFEAAADEFIKENSWVLKDPYDF